jgi:hypothetical protein
MAAATLAGGLVPAPVALAANSTVVGDLYYTRHCGGVNVKKVSFSFDGTALTIDPTVGIAATNGADGIIFAPDGDLLVGGQGPRVHKVNPTTAAIQTRNPGADAFHLSLDPSGDKFYATGIPGYLAEVPLNPFANGVVRGLSGNDLVITSLAFDTRGNAYYTAGGSGGHGSVGRIDMATFTTTRYLTNVDAAHGMAYDAYTGHLMLFGDSHVAQIDPATMNIVSTRAFAGVQFDQGTTDGRGHLFVADNNGQLLFMDYSDSHLVGAAGNFVDLRFLDSCLDDVAPLSGPGSFDFIAPTITGTATPAPNMYGWNNTPVTVEFTCTDAESGVAGCTGPTTLTGEGPGQSVTGTATDNAGNTASTTVGPINIDMTAPDISGAADRAANAGGWYNAPVTVSFDCSDALSGLVSCSGPTTLAADGAGQSVTGTAADMADNTASATVGDLNLDMTAPDLAITGGGTYTVDQMVTVACTAADSLSGLESDPCAAPLVSVPASSLGLGDHTFTVTATDLAGNSTTATATVTVGVTYASLCGLTELWVEKAGVAHSLCVKLQNAAAAEARGDMNAKAGLLDAYRHELEAQSGKSVTPEHAAILIELSRAL